VAVRSAVSPLVAPQGGVRCDVGGVFGGVCGVRVLGQRARRGLHLLRVHLPCARWRNRLLLPLLQLLLVARDNRVHRGGQAPARAAAMRKPHPRTCDHAHVPQARVVAVLGARGGAHVHALVCVVIGREGGGQGVRACTFGGEAARSEFRTCCMRARFEQGMVGVSAPRAAAAKHTARRLLSGDAWARCVRACVRVGGLQQGARAYWSPWG